MVVKTKVILVSLLLVGAIGVLYRDDIVDESLLLMMGGDTTVYTTGYSEEVFDEIKVGDSRREVVEKLGAPFEKRKDQGKNGDTVERFWYSKSNQDSHFRRRMIHFINDRVYRKVKEVHID